jgi:uncharacterized protein (TIGR00297 family)
MASLPNPIELLVGILLSAAIGWVGYRRESLSLSGVVGALLTGTIIFGLGGWDWGILLVAFFFSSSFLSHYREHDKAGLAEKFAKGHRRDLGQALANAGVGSILAVVSLFWDDPALFMAYVGAMAAVNADTWATEIGVLSDRAPRLITTGRKVDVGASGGITSLGLGASAAGAGFIGLLGSGAGLLAGRSAAVVVAVLAGAITGGLAGSLFDSLLGATLQAIYWCDVCGKETEQKVHRCGTATRRVRGLAWLGNDAVNLLASVVGAAVAGLSGWGVFGILR